MAIYHVLKDGSKVDSIAGRVIRLDDFKGLYGVIAAIEERGQTKRNYTNIKKPDLKKRSS